MWSVSRWLSCNTCRPLFQRSDEEHKHSEIGKHLLFTYFIYSVWTLIHTDGIILGYLTRLVWGSGVVGRLTGDNRHTRTLLTVTPFVSINVIPFPGSVSTSTASSSTSSSANGKQKRRLLKLSNKNLHQSGPLQNIAKTNSALYAS